MNVPIELTFRDVEKTAELEDLIRDKAARLDKFYNNISSCRVAVEKPNTHQESGSAYRVRLEVTVPHAREVVSKHDSSRGNVHENLPQIIRDVFDAAERQLKELKDKQRNNVKEHPQEQTVALVDSLFPEEDYGFLKTVDGRDVYFHRNSVLNGEFDNLSVGTGVQYSAEMGEKGLQATTVRVTGRPSE